MKMNGKSGTRKYLASLTAIVIGLALTSTCFARRVHAQTPSPSGNTAANLPADSKYGVYQTLYLTNITANNDANDLQTDLRNMLPNAKLFYVPSQSAISLRGTPEDIALARKILADLDHTKKIYRLIYTITETDGGKLIGAQHFALIVASGSRSELKQGSKVPIVIGSASSGTAPQNSGVQYVDVGLDIDASLDAYADGVKLRTRLSQSSVAEEKSGVGTQDPVIRQTTLEGTSTLVQGKPLVIGSLDIPGSTRHQQVEVASEIVR
jgi:type II secretory pathway component GspD/PulD (secretin)